MKTATNGGATGLSKTAQGIRELSNSLKGLNSGDASQKITRLTNALTALSQVGNVKISSSIANQLTAINTALAGLKWTDGDKLTSLANGLRPLSELGKANMTTFINQLSKLPKVIEDLEAADIDKFTQQMTALAAAMKPFADEMQKVSNGFSAFPSKIQKLITSTEKYNASARKATSTSRTKAGITFQLVDCLKTTYSMNGSNTNVNGWRGSTMRTSTMATLLNQLSSDLKSVLKFVNKVTSVGNSSSGLETTSDKLFLLSEIEVFGATQYSYAGEGKQYEYYTAGNSTIKKVNGSAYYWWERSPYSGNTNYFCSVNNNGNAGYDYASNSNGVSFGFCV